MANGPASSRDALAHLMLRRSWKSEGASMRTRILPLAIGVGVFSSTALAQGKRLTRSVPLTLSKQASAAAPRTVSGREFFGSTLAFYLPSPQAPSAPCPLLLEYLLQPVEQKAPTYVKTLESDG
jgi:hypothetical protein